jgi:general secretion pathway protein L
MAQRLIGIDLSTHWVRAFEVLASPRSIALGAYHEQPVPPPEHVDAGAPADGDAASPSEHHRPDDDWSARAGAALTALVARMPMRGVDAIAVGLNAPAHVSAIFTLPFNDPKVVEKVLPGEMSARLPMEDAEHISSFMDLGPAPEGGFNTLVVAAKPRELEVALKALSTADIDPQLASPLAFTQHRLLSFIRPDLSDAEGYQGPYVIVNVGALHTHLTIAHGDKLLQARTLLVGGDAVTEALSDALDLSLPAAEDLKRSRGFVAPHGQAQRWATSLHLEQGFVGERLISLDALAAASLLGVKPLLLGLRQLLAAFSARTGQRVEHAWLTGDGSRLRGLAELINHELQVPPAPLLPTPDPDAPLSELSRAYGLAISAPLALALAARSHTQASPAINLRQGRFSFRGGLDFLRDHALSFGIIAACLLAAVAFTLFARFNALAAERDHVAATLSRVSKDLFGVETLTAKAVQAQLESVTGFRYIPERSAYYHLAAITTYLSEEFIYDASNDPPDAPPPPNFELRKLVINLTTKNIAVEAAVSPNGSLQKFKRALAAYSCLPPNIDEIEQVNDTDIPTYTRVKFLLNTLPNCGAE